MEINYTVHGRCILYGQAIDQTLIFAGL